MSEFTNYSSRKFKVDHVKRLKLLRKKLKRTQQDILVDVVEYGLRKLEAQKDKRVVPFGIEEQ